MTTRSRTIYFIICFALAGGASAHAMLDSAEPGAGALLNASPPAIVLHFDSVLETVFCHIRVEDAAGNPVASGSVYGDEQHHTSLHLTLPALPSGHYRVNWLAVARDGHRTSGDYRFTVK